ncbi:MAG: hypothetical protein HC828_17930 [Blastochloris sp.]|nr:hypothetical protein [Blastochloris sp.]
MSNAILPTRPRRVTYPESDGKPMGETDLHRRLMTDLIFALKWFLVQTRAYVAGNLFVYYQEGNPKASVAPDVFVVLGAEQYDRRTYRIWEEGGRVPQVILELTSKKTRKADSETKPRLYAHLGVQEYVMFDPYGEWLRPPLQGFRLVNGTYQPMEEYPLRSAVLGLGIVGFSGSGIVLRGNGHRVQSSVVGLLPDQTSLLPNDRHGIVIDDGAQNLIGGPTDRERNSIAGNRGTGIVVQGAAATENQIQGNDIGIIGSASVNAAASDITPGNGQGGIVIEDGSDNTIGGTDAGLGNVVAGNLGTGIAIVRSRATGNIIQGKSDWHRARRHRRKRQYRCRHCA